jgi:glutaconate CoA-transferase, subunit B
MHTAGPTLVATDLCLMRPDPETKELTVVSVHAGVSREQISEATGWPVRFAQRVEQTPPPTSTELATLRDLQARTARAHGTASEHDAAG